jgi:hypothetical protein
MGEWAVARVQGVGSWELPFRSWLAVQGYAPTTVVDVVCRFVSRRYMHLQH